MNGFATRPSAPTVASDVLNLPRDFPDVPEEVLRRFPSLRGWEDEVASFWTKTKQVLDDGIQSHSNAISKTVGTINRNIRVVIGDLQAAITDERDARISADQALALDILTVSAAVGTKSRISVQSIAPSSPAIGDLWLDTGDQNRYKYWDGLAWQYEPDMVLVAAVSAESTARATADGFLEGKYTLTVVAGNVVTGMNITSSSGGGTNISSVIFRATDFLIYNSVTGVAMFTVSGTEIKLGDTLTVDTANSKMYIGAGAYADAATPFYVDDVGNFSLGADLTWDGTTLSISGSAVTTVDWATQITGRPTELTDGRIPAAINSAGLVISGVKPGINVTTGSAGLYLGADFMGYYNGAAWRTYMDNNGNFYLGGTSGALQWNGTTLSITGNITVTSISGLNYAGASSPGGAATSIVGQGALATLSAVSWTTQVSSRPTELTDGRIATAISAAGLVVSGVKPGIVVSPGGVAGLYLGSDFLGYYNGSAWRTYMDNSGNFYLGGTSGALQWNGTTLSITGSITVTSISGLNYAGASSPGGAATSIVGQAATATSSDFAVITGATKPSDNATVGAAWGTNLTGRPTELTDGRITTALNSAGLVISGVKPGINVTTGSAGLYLGADFLGYYNGSAWRTYMDNSGNFYLGGTSGALQWNGTTLTITGVINVTSITGVNYAGAASPGAAATSIVGQGALATQNTANYNTQLTNQPTNSAGSLQVATSPSGSGLFLGSDKLGFYASSAWQTYMDNTGKFYLGGTGGALQWDGSTLTIVGGGTFSGALSAATGTFSGSLSAATGTFAGSLSAASGTFAGVVDIGSGHSRLYIDSSKMTYGYGTDERTELFYDSGTSASRLDMYQGGNKNLSLYAGAGAALIHMEEPSTGGQVDIDTSGGVSIRRPTLGQTAVTIRTAGESNPRIVLRNNGEIAWGDGSGSLDTNLYRSAADVLKTDDAFHCAGLTSSVAINITGNINTTTGVSYNGGNVISFQWVGSVVQVWVDVTHVGDMVLV